MEEDETEGQEKKSNKKPPNKKRKLNIAICDDRIGEEPQDLSYYDVPINFDINFWLLPTKLAPFRYGGWYFYGIEEKFRKFHKDVQQ